MGGKTAKSSSAVSIPPEVMARYNAVNERAEQVAATPFKQYSQDPNAFVAPLNTTQIQGIQQAGGYAQAATPFYQQGADMTLQAGRAGLAGTEAAYQPLMQGYGQGQQYNQAAQGLYQQAGQAALPFFTNTQNQIGTGLMQGQGLGALALQQGMGAQAAAQPYNQMAGSGIQAGLAAAQPYNALATNAALAGSQAVNPEQFSQQGISQYMSPFMSNVVQQTMNAQAQQNAQQRQALTGDAIRAGAFGGDRAGIAQANLAYQQNLANQQTLANLMQSGYGQALGAFQQQQGVNLSAQQANRAAQQQLAQQALAIGQQGYGQQMGAAQQAAALGQQLYGQQMGTAGFTQGLGQQGFQQNLAAAQANQALGSALSGINFQQAQGMQGLGQQAYGMGQGTSAQQAALANQGYNMGMGAAQGYANMGAGLQAAGLQGAQAALQAGTVAQQTEQAGKQALYNQFLQEQGYPFQTAQFLANIAMGTGALSGSTTTTQQQAPFFSDERVKKDIEPIGETYDGQKIVKFAYKGSPQKQIGLIAQDVEKHHPEAVGLAGGVKTVNYDEATKEAAHLGRRSEGGGVASHHAGEGFSNGGSAFDPALIQQILANQQGQYAQMFGQPGSPRGAQGTPGASGRVPAASLPVGKLATASPPSREQSSGLSQAMSAASTGEKIADFVKKGKAAYQEYLAPEKGSDSNAAPVSSTTTVTPGGAAPAAAMKKAEAELPSAGGKIDVADLADEKDLLSNALNLAWTGGRIKKAGGGDAEDQDITAPEGMYKPTGAGINIPDEKQKNKLLEPAKPPGQMKSGLENVTDAVKTAAKVASMFFLKDGGVVPRAHKARGGEDVLEGEVLPPEEKKGLVRLAKADTGTATDAAPVGVAAASTTTPAATGVAPKPEPSSFDKSLARTFQFEGGLNKADTNGTPSLYGINQKYHPEFFKEGQGTRENAARIYKRDYWDAIDGDKLDPRLAHVAFDTAVIAGPAKAKQLMAQAENDPVKLLELRKGFQDSLIAKNPEKYGKYEKAWNNRVATLYNDVTGEKAPVGAPAVATPGIAGPGRPIQTASNAPFSAMTNAVLPEGVSKKARDILTSENLWVPALAGVGSMLASKSPFLGGAIGEGLVGATSAYTGLNKQQADIGQTLASTEKTISDIVGDAFKTDPNGITRVKYMRPDGSWDFMPLTEWSRLRREGKQPKLDPRVEKIAEEKAAQEEQRFANQGATPTGAIPKAPLVTGQPVAQPVQPGAPLAPPAQAQPAAPQYKYIDPATAKEIAKESEILMDAPNSALADQKDVFTPQREIATNAAAQKQSLLPFGGALASLPAEKDPLAGGGAQQVVGPIVNVLQGIGNMFGFQISDPSKIADYEEVKKEVARIRSQMAAAGNQSAVSALDKLGEGLPSNLNTKEAQARLYSTLLIANQREIDKNNFFNEWFDIARGPDGENARVASRTGRLATTKFDEKNNQEFYNEDKKNLEKIFRAKVEMGDGKEQNLMFLLTQANAPIPQELKDMIAQKYGDRIFRYFNIPYEPSKVKKKTETGAGSSVG